MTIKKVYFLFNIIFQFYRAIIHLNTCPKIPVHYNLALSNGL
jgi:hypothetical protein